MRSLQIYLTTCNGRIRRKSQRKKLLIYLINREVRVALERKLFVKILFVDFTKAFDIVPHNVLLYKIKALSDLGRNQNEDSLTVRINGSDSETQFISHGVPQGSVLGPTLLSLFTNDLPKTVHSASL